MGVSPEPLTNLFELFERAISSSNSSGLDLGLYLTPQIVQAHGGQVVATSKLGSGTTFTVQLPRLFHPTSPGN